MAEFLFKNLALLDVKKGRLASGYQVLVRDGMIARVAKGAIRAPKAETIDCGGRTLMPGLIDCHVHICARAGTSTPKMLPSLVAAYASDALQAMLMRGFTTVRDTGGADLGHKQAVERGLFPGPRLFVSGRAISQTGGHGDPRARADQRELGPCAHIGGVSRIADGVPEVRHAVRDEIRLGADHIKIMAGGGVGSAADPIDQIQYSTEELDAAVDEATRSHTYVLAHAYTAVAARRAAEAGVRTIEHGNLIDEAAANAMARAGAYLVPTLVTYYVLAKHGRELGRPAENLAKAMEVFAAGTRSLVLAKRAGVKMAFGTDLFDHPDILGPTPPSTHQSEEFLIRSEVLSPAEIIQSATVNGADVVRMPGRIGEVREGSLADLLVVDGDPLGDLRLLMGQGEHLAAIMKDGKFVKNRLGR